MTFAITDEENFSVIVDNVLESEMLDQEQIKVSVMTVPTLFIASLSHFVKILFRQNISLAHTKQICST